LDDSLEGVTFSPKAEPTLFQSLFSWMIRSKTFVKNKTASDLSVSILVLLDDSLEGGTSGILCSRPRVSILVLLDDSLEDSIDLQSNDSRKFQSLFSWMIRSKMTEPTAMIAKYGFNPCSLG